MKDHLEYLIERNRNAQLEAVAMLIKRRIMGYLQRKRFLKAREDVITIQKNYKVLCMGGWKGTVELELRALCAFYAQLARLPYWLLPFGALLSDN